MASKNHLLLLPPRSANPRMVGLSESKLLDAIHAVYRTIINYNSKDRIQSVESIHNTFGWVVSNTLNGNVEQGFIYRTSCIRGELVFLCVTYASTVCFHIHREFVDRNEVLTKNEVRSFFRRLLDVYYVLRDVAKPQLLAWTTAPTIPDVAECSVHTINFMISLCCALYGMCCCKLARLQDEKPSKDDWATMTLFVAERFETCYSILQDRIWPVYGRHHPSAHEVAVLLSGYALHYRTKSYAARLRDEEFICKLSHRQIIALARCTEYLVAPLRTGQAGFDPKVADICIDDMRRIVHEHLGMCEQPVIGMTSIETAQQCRDMMSIIMHLMPPSAPVMDYVPSDRRQIRHFVLDPKRGNYNIIEHTIRPSLTRSVAASAQAGVRKPRFEIAQ